MRTWQFIAVATTLYFGSAAPAAADELPLVPTQLDAAAVVESIATDVAPDVAPVVEEVMAQQAPVVTNVTPEPAPTAQPPPEPQQESQYHEPEPQYQPPATDAAEPVSSPSSASEASPDSSAPAPAPDPATTPTAATVSDATASATAAPDTWTWNWTWNCDAASAPPAESSADGSARNWIWNWAWNCDREPITRGDASQYQATASQYQPENVNVSIRVFSPGDNEPVTQAIAAVAAAVATNTTTLVQEVVDTAAPSAPLGVPPPLVPAVTVPALPPFVITSGPMPIELPLAPLPPFSLPVLPPLELELPPLEVPAAAAAIVEAVTEALGAKVSQVAATRSAAPPRPRSVNAREPQHVAVADAGASWRRPTAAGSGRARPPGGEPSRPGSPLLPPLPIPNAPAMGSAQLGGNANGVLAAFAALLAAYFLYPYLAARPVRVPRDRRRLRPRAARFDKPG